MCDISKNMQYIKKSIFFSSVIDLKGWDYFPYDFIFKDNILIHKHLNTKEIN